MTDSRTKHLEILKRARRKRNGILLSVALGCIAFGALFSCLYGMGGHTLKAFMILVPFALIFPLGLFCLLRNSIGKDFTESVDTVSSGQPVTAYVDSLDAISGSVRLRTKADEGLFEVADPAFGLINALKCEMKVFDAAQRERRREIVREYEGKEGVLYSNQSDERAVLFINKTALKLRRISRQRAEEIEQFQQKLRNR